jgi:hypothetical protein
LVCNRVITTRGLLTSAWYKEWLPRGLVPVYIDGAPCWRLSYGDMDQFAARHASLLLLAVTATWGILAPGNGLWGCIALSCRRNNGKWTGGRRFESPWGQWIFFKWPILPAALSPAVDSASNRNDYEVKSYPRNRPWRPIELWDVEDPTLSRQSAHRWWQGCQCALYSPETWFLCFWYSFLLEAE